MAREKSESQNSEFKKGDKFILGLGEKPRTDGDLIRRQEAIDTLMELIANGTNKGMISGEDALHRVEVLPSAQSERKKGKWIEDAEMFYSAVNKKGGGVNENTPLFTEDDVACSECLTLFNVLENRTDIFSFCPNCGADMRRGH